MNLLETITAAEPLIQVATLLALLKYASDTTRIMRATVAQSQAIHQPCLVLEMALREQNTVIFAQAMKETAPSTRLADRAVIHNIGVGPAYSISYSFAGGENNCLNDAPALVPYLLPGKTIEIAYPRALLVRGAVTFSATYKGLTGVCYQSIQSLEDGALLQLQHGLVPSPSWLGGPDPDQRSAQAG